MPSKKYYRTALPTAILNLVGEFAGDSKYKLRFTFSDKRGFLSTIFVQDKFGNKYTKLKKKHWNAVSVENIFPHKPYLTKSYHILKICHYYEREMIALLDQVQKLLSETIDYILIL